MKKVLFLTITLCLIALVDMQAQMVKMDASPADISYFREGGERNTAPLVRVIYSRPQKNGRDIFGDLEPYGEVWRTGANEATEITLYEDATIGGKEVKAGTYALFTIPGEENWTIILNSALHQWGDYSYDESKDVVRVEVPAQGTEEAVEAFTIAFNKVDGGAHMIMAWDDAMVEVPFMF